MAGYHGYSMSNNAVSAYKDGEKPFSKWTKKSILAEIQTLHLNKPFLFDLRLLNHMPLLLLKEMALSQSSWHHTSKFYNNTDFYSVTADELYDCKNNQDLLDAIDFYKHQKEEISQPEKTCWECKFLEWGGTRSHPKAIEHIEIGIIKGNWFYRKDGSKKSILSNGFQQIRQIKE